MNISNRTSIVSLFIITLLITAVSCDSSSGPELVDADEVEIDFFFNLQQPFDLLLGNDAVLEGRISVFDEQQDIEVEGVYLYLYSLTVSSQGLDLDLSESPVKLYQISGEPFAAIENGISGDITVPLAAVIENLPAEVEPNQFNPGDIMGMQWRVRLNNGLKVTQSCSEAGINYYCIDMEMVHSLPEGAFTGLYTFTQLDSSSVYLTETVDEPQLFSGMQFESELTPVQNWYGDQRTFLAEYLKFMGFEVGSFDYALKFDVASGSVTLRETRLTGVACSASVGLYLGPEKESLSSFDLNDDSEFMMVLTDNTEGDCSSSPVQVRFHVQKSE